MSHVTTVRIYDGEQTPLYNCTERLETVGGHSLKLEATNDHIKINMEKNTINRATLELTLDDAFRLASIIVSTVERHKAHCDRMRYKLDPGPSDENPKQSPRQ